MADFLQKRIHNDRINLMSFKENIQHFFKAKEVVGVENTIKIYEAFKQEKRVTADYLSGRISLEKYKQRLEETHPLTRFDSRRLASAINRHN